MLPVCPQMVIEMAGIDKEKYTYGQSKIPYCPKHLDLFTE